MDPFSIIQNQLSQLNRNFNEALRAFQQDVVNLSKRIDQLEGKQGQELADITGKLTEIQGRLGRFAKYQERDIGLGPPPENLDLAASQSLNNFHFKKNSTSNESTESAAYTEATSSSAYANPGSYVTTTSTIANATNSASVLISRALGENNSSTPGILAHVKPVHNNYDHKGNLSITVGVPYSSHQKFPSDISVNLTQQVADVSPTLVQHPQQQQKQKQQQSHDPVEIVDQVQQQHQQHLLQPINDQQILHPQSLPPAPNQSTPISNQPTPNIPNSSHTSAHQSSHPTPTEIHPQIQLADEQQQQHLTSVPNISSQEQSPAHHLQQYQFPHQSPQEMSKGFGKLGFYDVDSFQPQIPPPQPPQPQQFFSPLNPKPDLLDPEMTPQEIEHWNKIEFETLNPVPQSVADVVTEWTTGYRGQPPLKYMERYRKTWRKGNKNLSKKFCRRHRIITAIEVGVALYAKEQGIGEAEAMDKAVQELELARTKNNGKKETMYWLFHNIPHHLKHFNFNESGDDE